MIDKTIGALVFGLVVVACATVEEGEPAGTGEGPTSCEHGTFSPCACSDGSMGTQLCAHDTSGFEECMCGGADDDTAGGPDSTPSSEDDSSGGVDPSATDESGPADTSVGPSTETSGSNDTGPFGAPPTAMINHPGGEDRQAGVAIPFIGVADDPEDGALSGASMIWTDDLEGMIGQGEAFDAALAVVGEHTVTLTATDADGNVGEATLTFAIVP
jgi:hypothetical protein